MLIKHRDIKSSRYDACASESSTCSQHIRWTFELQTTVRDYHKQQIQHPAVYDAGIRREQVSIVRKYTHVLYYLRQQRNHENGNGLALQLVGDLLIEVPIAWQ